MYNLAYVLVAAAVSAALSAWKAMDKSQEDARNEPQERMAALDLAKMELQTRLEQERALNAKLVESLPVQAALAELHALRASREALMKDVLSKQLPAPKQ